MMMMILVNHYIYIDIYIKNSHHYLQNITGVTHLFASIFYPKVIRQNHTEKKN